MYLNFSIISSQIVILEFANVFTHKINPVYCCDHVYMSCIQYISISFPGSVWMFVFVCACAVHVHECVASLL